MAVPTLWAEPAGSLHISLLLCTVNRVAELERLLGSLRTQRFQRFDIVLVDQNPDDRLLPLLRRFTRELTIHHIRSTRGLSRARNAGLPYCSGEIVALPDDDCWYPPGLLGCVATAFAAHPDIGFVIGRWRDERGRNMIDDDSLAEPATDHHVWTRAISYTTFLRRAAILRVGGFDERLGVGAGTPWGAGEETDYLLRALECGIQGWYEPDCIVCHPAPPERSTRDAAARAFSYGRGIGFVLRKHCASGARILRFLFRPLAGAALSFFTLRWSRARFHLLVFTGRCIGLLGV